MKKIILLFLFFYFNFSFSQENDSIKSFSKEYDELMSYIPKKTFFSSSYKPKAELLQTELNTINNISLYAYFANKIKLPKSDERYLETRIENLAKGFFFDNKKLIISKTGGYNGCIEKMIDTFKLKKTIITNLKFCYSCTNWNIDDYFLETFNSKMYQLMNIKAPDYGTSNFNGEFINKKKKSDFKKLVLNKDRSFQLFKVENNTEKIYSSFWENNEFILKLDLSKYNDLKDLEFEYILNRRKIIGLNEKNIKFKKTENN